MSIHSKLWIKLIRKILKSTITNFIDSRIQPAATWTTHNLKFNMGNILAAYIIVLFGTFGGPPYVGEIKPFTVFLNEYF